MSRSDRPPDKTASVALVAEKARADRVRRLKQALEQRLEAPLVAIDVLMSELADGDAQTELWEQLHIAAARDGQEAAVGDAYAKGAIGPRMKRLPPEAQAALLMHAADFFQGVIGDPEAAEEYLRRVLTIVPGHADAFTRLEKRLEKLLDARRILELYASVAAAPPKAASVLATQAFNRLLQLTPKDPLPDAACKELIALVATNPRVLEALDTHCRATKRPGLACALFEQALLEEAAPPAALAQRRHRLLELYMAEEASRALAIGHVEELLKESPNDAVAFKVAERLLSVTEVTSRAAAALLAARRGRG